MASEISRLDFKRNYDHYSQGLFIFKDRKRLPKEQSEFNAGQMLSKALSEFPIAERKNVVSSVLNEELSSFKAVTLTRIEILFTPYLELDVIGLISSQCRNRKICIVWPGIIENGKAYYASPEEPEYYECELARFQETYIIKD